MLSSKINQITLLTIPKFLPWTRLNWVFLPPDTLFFLDPFIRSFPSWKNQSPGDSELIWDTPPHRYLSDQDQACSLLISSTDPSKPSGFTSGKMCMAVWFGKQREACVATCAFKNSTKLMRSSAPIFVEEFMEKLFSPIFQKRKCLLVFWNFFMSLLRL